MKHFAFYQTIIGWVGIAESEGVITDLFFGREHLLQDGIENETPTLRKAANQLTEYLNGTRQEFSLVLEPEGTPFQKTVWAALCSIPYGETRSYKQIASAIGRPTACRAVGMANNKNPIAILIPCHRVIGSNGKMVGYAGGMAAKEELLKIEKRL